MPNQRAADKKAVSTWIPKNLKNALVKLARARGQTLAGYVQSLYEAAVARSGGAGKAPAKSKSARKPAPAKRKRK